MTMELDHRGCGPLPRLLQTWLNFWLSRRASSNPGWAAAYL
jgi:hypothetical protein